MARLQERYTKEIVPSSREEVQPTEPAEPSQAAEDRHQHGRRQDACRTRNASSTPPRTLGPDRRPAAQITQGEDGRQLGFRLRENNEIGCRVTLRGKRMYEFMDRLINAALPRIRDFRGLNPKSFDGNGNYSMGLTEQLVFPEIDPDKVNFQQGMDVTFVTSTRNDDEARELLRGFGMPFRE